MGICRTAGERGQSRYDEAGSDKTDATPISCHRARAKEPS